MIKTRLAVAFAAVLASASCLAQDAQPAAIETGPDTLIATVNGVPYKLDVFNAYLSTVTRNAQIPNNPEVLSQLKAQLLNAFMTAVVTSQEGERRKLADLPEVARAIEAAQQAAKMEVLATAAESAIAQEIDITDEELKEAYEQIKANARTEYKARHILVKDEAEAKKLIDELGKGGDFVALAKEHSLGPTGKNGGELDWFDSSQMVKPFADAVAAMEPGTYSKEPVKTEFGWHVIELQEERKAEPPPFEEAKTQLTALVQRQKLAEKLTEMRNTAMVEFNEQIVPVQKASDAATEAK